MTKTLTSDCREHHLAFVCKYQTGSGAQKGGIELGNLEGEKGVWKVLNLRGDWSRPLTSRGFGFGNLPKLFPRSDEFFRDVV